MSREITEELFLKDVEKHEMKVLLDNGLYRHLRFASTGEHSWNQWFEIVTWPGRLAYSGDMGTYVFQRLEDMFEFFRSRPRDGEEQLYINTGYWAEKLEAVDRCGRESGYEKFSEERFKKRIEEEIKEWVERFPVEYDSDEEDEARKKKNFETELREAIRDDIYSYLGDGEFEARRRLNEFSFTPEVERFDPTPREYRFEDTWEWDCTEYTLRFVWCCYALAWGIQQYDKVHELTGAAK